MKSDCISYFSPVIIESVSLLTSKDLLGIHQSFTLLLRFFFFFLACGLRTVALVVMHSSGFSRRASFVML